MPKLLNSLHAFLNQFPDWPIIIAYSGGVDSQVLLHTVATLKKNNQITNPIQACHVNHGLSANARSWVEFATTQCQQLNIELITAPVTLNLASGESIEALAREARYKALINAASKPSLILTGHHSDDQAETFLLALKRGAGVKGLSAMKEISGLAQHTLARPLLDMSRKDIVEYAEQHELNWIEDESNSDTRFDRNYIRQSILPELSNRWPSITQTINRSAKHCRQSQELLDELAVLDLKACHNVSDTNSLSIEVLSKLSVARFNNVLRYFLEQKNCLMPTTKQLEEIKQQLLCKGDQMPEITVDNKVIRRFDGNLYLTEQLNDVSDYINVVQLSDILNQTNNQHPLYAIELPDGLGRLVFLPDGICFNKSMLLANEKLMKEHRIGVPKKLNKLEIRFNHNNPKVLPEYRQHHRPLKKVLQELKIAPWERKRTPLIFADNELVLITGYAACKAYIPEPETIIIRVHWLKPE